MPRRPRLEFDGALYHIFTRGNRREPVFCDDGDRRRFLDRLQVVTMATDVELYAYVLMINHLHLVVRRRHVSISRFMHLLLSPYGRYFNRKHGTVGHVFQGRYGAILCQDETYLLQLVRYVHRNPVRSGLSRNVRYDWSSYGTYLNPCRETWMNVRPILGMFGREPQEALDGFVRFHEIEQPEIGTEDPLMTGDYGILGNEEFATMAHTRAARSVALGGPQRPWLDDVLAETLNESGILIEAIEVRGPSRCRPARAARAAFVERAVKRYGYSYVELAGYLRRAPSTVRVIFSRNNGR